jgi:pimeloyl-ACP methyl ester carboxylesterase
MNPIFFGRSPKSLFGVYHPPKAAQSRPTGVVLCYPFGQEYMRAHRAFRQMALLLSKAGFHVLRFDYTGTGDSSGEATETSLAEWADDARQAADELKETGELERVSFVGLRLGACIAALAAAGRSDVDELVLWDPPMLGKDYLAEILEERTDSVGNSRLSSLTGDMVGVMGFPITRRLRDELTAFDLRKVGTPTGSSSRFVVASHERPEYTELGRLDVGAAKASFQLVPSEGNWNEVDDYGGALIPVFLIQAIVARLSQGAR